MITEEQGIHIGEEWIAAWNSHDLDAVMAHYADDIIFISPFVIKINNDATGTITGKAELRQYFERALQAYPDLNFLLYKILVSVSSVVLYYRSVNNLAAAEFMELNSDDKVCRVYAHYAK